MNRSIYSRRKNHDPRSTPVYAAQPLPGGFLQTLPLPMCILDRLTGTYLEVNPAFARLLGLRRDQIVQKSGSDLTAGPGDSYLKKIFHRLENETGACSMDILIFQHGGQVIKSGVQAQWVDFEGKEAILLAFKILPELEPAAPVENVSEQVQAVNRLSQKLAGMDQLEEIVRQLAGSTFEIAPESCAVLVSLVDTSRCCISQVYRQHAGESFQLTDFPEMRYDPESSSLITDSIRAGQPLITDQHDERTRTAVHRMGLSIPGKLIQSAVSIPMMAGETVVGVLQAFSNQPFQYTGEVPVLSLMAVTTAHAIHSSQLALRLERTSQDLALTYEATIDGWTRALELRDFSTERHTERVVSMTVELGRKIGLEDPDLLRLKRGAQLHDIGKMGVPDSILLKSGPLDESEWRVMRKHPVYAYELLRPIPKFSDIIDIPYCHHEKWDGSGYPRRLKGAEIPMPARIFAVVDVWDALSSNRPYRTAWPQHQVLDYIQNQSSKYFEPDVTHAFLDIVKGKTFTRGQTMPLFRRPIADSFGHAN